MENTSFFLTVFLTCLIISITVFSLNQGFGKQSNKFLDPFEEHES